MELASCIDRINFDQQCNDERYILLKDSIKFIFTCLSNHTNLISERFQYIIQELEKVEARLEKLEASSK